MTKPNAAIDGAVVCRANGTRLAASVTDLEVRDLSVVDVLLGVAAAQNKTRTKPTGERPLPKESAITASPPWPKTCFPASASAAACLRRRAVSVSVSANGIVTVIVIVKENGIVIVNEIVTGTAKRTRIENATATATLIVHRVPVETTMALMTVSGKTARMNESGSIAAELIEVRMMSSSLMEMSDHQVHEDDDKMTTMVKCPAETRETPRYVI